MIFTLFKSLVYQLSVAVIIAIVAATTQLLLYNKDYALRFLEIAIIDMNGLGVWCFGVGLMFFVGKVGNMIAQELNETFQSSPSLFEIVAKIEKSTRHKDALILTAPIATLGGVIVLNCNVPHFGISSVFISIGVVFIYYTASYLLYHFFMIISAFHTMYKNIDGVHLESQLNSLHLENISSYLAQTSSVGLLAIYFGFRGTVTAGFIFSHPIWKFFLVTPLILFLPGTLFYNFYPRHVLKKLLRYKIFNKLMAIAANDDVDVKNAIVEIKGVSLMDAQVAPFVDYKNLPSYLIGVLFLMNIVYDYDPVIRSFFQFIFRP